MSVFESFYGGYLVDNLFYCFSLPTTQHTVFETLTLSFTENVGSSSAK